MGDLNVRQERFARYVAKGIPPVRAYPMAGYRAHAGEPYRLRDNPRVQARIHELMEKGMEAEKLTPHDIIAGLVREAQSAKEGATRVRAYELLGKHLGIWNADRDPNSMTVDELRMMLVDAIRTDPDIRALAAEALDAEEFGELIDSEPQGSA